jgi:hypothetical protein
VHRRQVSVSGVLLALLLATPEAWGQPAPAGEGNCADPGPQVRVGDRVFVNAATRVCSDRGTSAFVMDATAPTIRWEVGNPKEFENRLAPDTEKDRRRLRGRRSGGRPAEDAWPSLAGVWQIPVPWVRSQDLARVARFPVEIASDHPQAFFSAPQTALTVEGSQAVLGDGRVLWVAADDADGVGVDRLTFRTRNEGDRMVLEVEAADLVGNVGKKEILLRKGPLHDTGAGGNR